MSDSPPSADPIKFAYWVPSVSGALVVSSIERTDWRYDYNKKLAALAENSGFEYALSQVQYGVADQHESAGFSLALLLATRRLKVIAAVDPGLWHPGVLAKFVATADQLSNGRAAVNVVSSRMKDEFTKLGEPWLEHDERYRRCEEFIQVLRELWTSDHADFTGDFYRLHDFDLKPKPVRSPDHPHPEIFQGGDSTAARRAAGRVADWYFSDGNTLAGVAVQIADVHEEAARHGRQVRIGLNGFMIARDREAEARDALREVIAKAHLQAVQRFDVATHQAGQSTLNKEGTLRDSPFDDLVQYNDGFRTRLIGTPEQVATRIIDYKKRGVNLMLLDFLHYLDDVEYFGNRVLPLVRALEQDLLERGDVTCAIPA